MNLTRTTDKSLWIDDAWLAEKAHTHGAYVDVKELQKEEGQYYAWLVAKYGKKEAKLRANDAAITFTGIRVNDASDYWIKCQLASDKVAHRRYFAPGVTHPNMVQRIYAHRTSARGIEIVGLAGFVG